MAGADIRERGAAGGEIGNVERRGLGAAIPAGRGIERGHGGGQRPGAAAVEDDMRAGLGEGPGDLEAEPARRPGHQCDPAGQRKPVENRHAAGPLLAPGSVLPGPGQGRRTGPENIPYYRVLSVSKFRSSH